jgi:hypothetical protein
LSGKLKNKPSLMSERAAAVSKIQLPKYEKCWKFFIAFATQTITNIIENEEIKLQ